ncbi:uncharacterized protein LOC144143469 [Haemaphysalis longicornis]
MQGSSGAVNAALSGRGNRIFADDKEYQVSLPALPTGRIVLNTVFLHGDMRARPYRVEDFRETLARLELLPEVLALGAFQMSHVWAVTFKSEHGVKKILEASDVRVKGHRCIAIDPANQDLRLKMHWLLHNVTEEDIRVALAPYGRVSDVSRERWRVQGVQDKGSTTRSVTLKLKAGLRAEDLPHQIRVAGELALVVVPGRPPQCLRCQGSGHMRRDCKVPRCTVCRRFGHEAAQCTRTYAAVAAPVGADDLSELVMDADETEELAAGDAPKPRETPESPDKEPNKSAPLMDEVKPFPGEETRQNDDTGPDAKPEKEDAIAPPGEAPGDCNIETPVSATAEAEVEDGKATKRPRQEYEQQLSDEVPGDGKVGAKGRVARRPCSKLKSSSSPYDRGAAAAKPP